MRRLFSALLVLAVLISLAGCTTGPVSLESTVNSDTTNTTEGTPLPTAGTTGKSSHRTNTENITSSVSAHSKSSTTIGNSAFYTTTTGHIHRFVDNGKEPTCTAKGYAQKRCDCGVELSETLPALGHDYALASQKAAGCTTEGTSTFSCRRCHQQYSEMIQPLGHIFGGWQITREPLNDKDGEAVRTCNGCSKKETKLLKSENKLADGTWGEMTWVVYKDGTLTVTGSGVMPDGNIDGAYVSQHILPGWCAYKQEITSIVLDDRITVIGVANFSGLYNATSIHLPASLKEIRAQAFSTSGLGDGIVFPAGLTTIGTRAFEHYKGESLSLPSSVTTVGFYAFAFSPHLKTADLSSVTTFGEGAFTQCRKLEKVTLSSKLKQIAPSQFKDCTLLTKITIPDAVESIGDKAFANCTALCAFSIGDDSHLKSIGNYALPTYLKVFTIPKSVVTIGTGNFKNAYEVLNLSSATVPFDSTAEGAQLITQAKDSRITRISGFTFYTTPAGCGLLIGCDTDDTRITIPQQYTYEGQNVAVTHIPRYGIQGLARVETVELPITLQAIDSFGFFQCPALTACVWPSTQFALDAVNFSWKKGYLSDSNSLLSQGINVFSPGGKEFYCVMAKGSCGSNAVYKLYGKQSDLMNTRVLSLEGSGSVTDILHRNFTSTSQIKYVVINPGITELANSCLTQFLSAQFVFTGTQEQWNQIKKGYSWGIGQKTLQYKPDFFL